MFLTMHNLFATLIRCAAPTLLVLTLVPSAAAAGSPAAIKQCMDELMYETKRVCYGYGTPQHHRYCREDPYGRMDRGEWRTVRGEPTGISEQAAALACQHAK